MTGPEAFRERQDGSLPRAAMAARLQSGRSFETATRGVSMAPFLKEGDRVRVAAADPARLGLGDLVAFWRRDELIVHRFAGWAGPEAFWEKGDNVRHWTRVPAECLAGRVVEVARDGAWRSLERPMARLGNRWIGIRARLAGLAYEGARTLVHRLRGRRPFTDEERLLLQVARLDPDPAQLERLLAGPLAWERVLADARVFGMMPLLHHHLEAEGRRERVPGPVRRELAQAYQRQSLKGLQIAGALSRVRRALEAEGIPLLLLKGAFLGPWLYGDAALRPMSDLDLLIRPEHYGPARARLAELGFHGERQDPGSHYNSAEDEAILHQVAHPPPLFLDRVCRLELHLAVLQDGRPNPGLLEACWREPWSPAGSPGLPLEPLVVFLAGHLDKHVAQDGSGQLYWFTDLHELLRQVGPRLDPVRIAGLARDLGKAGALQRVFGWLKEGWDTPLPAGLPAGGGPPLAKILEAGRRPHGPARYRLGHRLGQVRHVPGLGAKARFLITLVVPAPAKMKAMYHPETPLQWIGCYLARPFRPLASGLSRLVRRVRRHP